MNNDNKKCDKFEAFFVFQNEEAFYNHINNCPDCKKEYETQKKVSSLIKEVAPIYLNKQKQKKITSIKKLACCFLFFVGITAFYTGYNIYDDHTSQMYWTQDSCVSSMGLPVDEYGFLEI